MQAGHRALALLLVSYSTLSWAIVDKPPIEVYGDSLTAGFLSGTDVTAAPPLKTISQILSDMVMYGVTKDPKHIIPHHRPDLAWPEQLARLQMQSTGIKTPVTNAAVSGAKTENLLGQVQSVKGSPASVQAFFFIGHNDLCNNLTEPEALAKALVDTYDSAIAEWDRLHQGATAYVLPVGDISQVYRILQGHVWYKGDKGKYACEDSWEKLFPYCISHHKKAMAGTLETYLKPRLTAINRNLEALAEKWNRGNGRNQYRFLGALQDQKFYPDYFAVDCYHLSANGQKTLADEIHRQID